MIGIIGGSGVYNLNDIEVIDTFNVSTPFGDTSDNISKIKIDSSEMFFYRGMVKIIKSPQPR